LGMRFQTRFDRGDRSSRASGPPAATGEHYDLIVIGAGISGLASAFLYRQRMGCKL